jgi:ATP-dependent protease ClpP protease subunit
MAAPTQAPPPAADTSRLPRQWYRVSNTADSDTAELWIFDEIGGWFGVAASDFVNELRAIKASNLDVHLNSPGGNVFDGIAIYNAIRTHPAKVTTYVMGLAASAASFIAMAADRVVMRKHSQMMIHDAQGVGLGNSQVMKDLADLLERQSDNIAGIYADRAGGDVADWREAMRKETWYSDTEAVDAGLADEIDTDAQAVSNTWDLGRIFNYAGREAAPAPQVFGTRDEPAPEDTAPVPPPRRAERISPAAAAAKIHAASNHAPVAAPADGPTTEKEQTVADAAKLREALGLAADASDDDVREAVAKAFADDSDDDKGDEDVTDRADEDLLGLPRKVPSLGEADGPVLVDASQIKALRAMAIKGEQAYETMRRNQRDTYLTNAMQQGKFPPARLEHYKKLWDSDPEGTRELLNRMAPNLVPVLSDGVMGGDDMASQADLAYKALYPEG